MLLDLQPFADADFCYLTTIGRVTGRPHTIEIWFALNRYTLYMLAGDRDRSDWVKNALHSPEVQVKINDANWLLANIYPVVVTTSLTGHALPCLLS